MDSFYLHLLHFNKLNVNNKWNYFCIDDATVTILHTNIFFARFIFALYLFAFTQQHANYIKKSVKYLHHRHFLLYAQKFGCIVYIYMGMKLHMDIPILFDITSSLTSTTSLKNGYFQTNLILRNESFVIINIQIYN